MPAPDGAADGVPAADAGAESAPDAAAGPEARPCPCLSGDDYASCCGRFHRGEAAAPTAEALMRSRYSAFVLGDTDYLLRTWHPDSRPPTLQLDPELRWLRLDIEETRGGGWLDTEGTVEFRAHFRAGGSRGQQHEISRFLRENGQWFYLDAL